MKKCLKCKLSKDLREFGKMGKYLNPNCKDCERIRKSKYYKANKAKFKKRARIYDEKKRIENRELIDGYRKSHPCIQCGESDFCCLDFHHKDGEDKKYDFGQLKKKAYSTKTIMEELAKCVILCANCHRKYHAGRFII